jgi:hypothetical protein
MTWAHRRVVPGTGIAASSTGHGGAALLAASYGGCDLSTLALLMAE